VVNLNGIDLDALLNRRFHEMNPELAQQLRTKSPGGYPVLILNLDGARQVVLDDAVLLRGYYRSVLHLADGERGHLRAHPLLQGDDGRQVADRLGGFHDRGLGPGDALFLEETTDGSRRRFTSLGHHFYYRWRYRTTVHVTPLPADQAAHTQATVPGLRDVLSPRREEMTPDRPEKLSGARLLFGFVGTSHGTYSDREPLTFGMGVREEGGKVRRTDFAQLAGRIGVNAAVEQNHEAPLSERFLNHEHEYLVPLRPLGAPKPSAVEHYLTQDRLDERRDGGILCTYGDTPDDIAVGRLRGRKFYLHQPKAKDHAECYELRLNSLDWKSGNNFNLFSDQAAVARYVSKPGRQFRFAVRFTSLRAWELGILLFCLEPTLEDVRALCEKLPESCRGPLLRWLQKVEQKGWHAGKEPLLAHRLGHGRPLGMGSVTVCVDRMRRLVRDNQRCLDLHDHDGDALRQVRQETLVALAVYLRDSLGSNLAAWVERCFVPWLQVHRYVGRYSFDYPRRDRQGERTVFNYHSELRGRHAEGRKRRAAAGNRQRVGLPELNDLD
jgi:CRISPR-associated protein (TIGR03986 family)